MKISSLWVAGNPLLPREVVSFCSLRAQVKWFHSKFSRFKVLINSSQVSAFWFHSSCLSPPDFMCAVWTVFDLVVLLYQSLREHLCISAFGDSWDAHRHGEPAGPCSSRGTPGGAKPSPGVSPGHSPEGKCPGVGSKPPFWLTSVQACLEPLLCCSMAVPWMKAPLSFPHRGNTEISFSNWKCWRHGQAGVKHRWKGEEADIDSLSLCSPVRDGHQEPSWAKTELFYSFISGLPFKKKLKSGARVAPSF